MRLLPLVTCVVMAERFENLPFPNCDRTAGCYCRSCHVDRVEVYAAKEIEVLAEDLRNSCLQEGQFVQQAFWKY